MSCPFARLWRTRMPLPHRFYFCAFPQCLPSAKASPFALPRAGVLAPVRAPDQIPLRPPKNSTAVDNFNIPPGALRPSRARHLQSLQPNSASSFPWLPNCSVLLCAFREA
jgi:hypothetical protein